mmetsp:Transcript_13047/g.30932  ORF Transcript_13047/g.30932 Transcript_13047/m.30932 type:complete len:254 (+) Transcript_13047:464-1225(+)
MLRIRPSSGRPRLPGSRHELGRAPTAASCSCSWTPSGGLTSRNRCRQLPGKPDRGPRGSPGAPIRRPASRTPVPAMLTRAVPEERTGSARPSLVPEWERPRGWMPTEQAREGRSSRRRSVPSRTSACGCWRRRRPGRPHRCGGRGRRRTLSSPRQKGREDHPRPPHGAGPQDSPTPLRVARRRQSPSGQHLVEGSRRREAGGASAATERSPLAIRRGLPSPAVGSGWKGRARAPPPRAKTSLPPPAATAKGRG